MVSHAESSDPLPEGAELDVIDSVAEHLRASLVVDHFGVQEHQVPGI